MSHHKITSKEWQKFSKQISFSKEAVEQLSKLYIIIHQKVKSSIRNSVLHPEVNFIQQVKHHIQFIKTVVQKIKDTQHDQYLVQVQREMLIKYEKNLAGLLGQIQIMLKIQESKINLDLNSLKGIKQQKRQEYDLKSQVQQSGKRIVRAKSGFKSRNNSAIKQQTVQRQSPQQKKQSFDSFFPTNINTSYDENKKQPEINNAEDLLRKFEQKRKAVQSKMQHSISKTANGLGISFGKKYEQNYLQMYLKERKQFADLIFNQKTYHEIITKNQNSSPSSVSNLNPQSQSFNLNVLAFKNIKTQQLNSKVFPQFQIKTKFMKQGVKQKISNLITDIKKELLKQYFSKNIQTLKAAKETIVEGNEQKRKPGTLIFQKSRSVSNIQMNSELQENRNNLMKKNSNKDLNDGKNSQFQSDNLRSMRGKSLNQLRKGSIFEKGSRKSFINQNSKPFYQTQNWNSQTQRKHNNKILSKLVQAKI